MNDSADWSLRRSSSLNYKVAKTKSHKPQSKQTAECNFEESEPWKQESLGSSKQKMGRSIPHSNLKSRPEA